MSINTDSGVVVGYGKNAAFWFNSFGNTTTSKTTAANVEDDKLFATIADSISSVVLNPGIIERNGNELKFLFEHSTNSDAMKAADCCTGSCRACTNAACILHKLSDMNGPIFMTNATTRLLSEADSTNANWLRLAQASKNACRERVVAIKILHSESESISNLPKTSGVSPEGNPWTHLMINVPVESRSSKNVTPLMESTFIAAVKRYILDGQLTGPDQRGGPGSQFNAAYEQGLVSWQMAKDILSSVTYGSTFIPAINLMIGMLEELGTRHVTEMSPKERILFFAKNLGPIGEDLYSGAVAPLWQTIKQISDLLATAHNQTAFKKICDERLSPLNYMRREALSEGQLNTAMSILPPFTIKVATVSYFPNAVPVGLSTVDVVSNSVDAFAALMVSTSKKNSLKSFAERCGETGGNILEYRGKVFKGTSLKSLIDFVKKNPEIEVLIDTTNGSLTYLAEISLPEEYLSVPFGWCFMQQFANRSSWKMSGWMPIEYIIPTYENLAGTKYSNVFITVKNAVIPPETKVCTFPEFLSSKYVRVCGPAFEALSETMKLEIPDTKPLAFGIGTNTDGTKNTLISKIHVKINGTTHILTDMV